MTRRRFPSVVRWVIWAALVNCLVVYLLLLKFGDIVPEGKTEESGLRMIFYVLGFSFAVASMGIKQVVAAIRTPQGQRKTPEWIDMAFIVCLALAEASGIFGFVLGVLGHPFRECLPLFVISFAAFILAAPVFFYATENESVVSNK